MIAILQKEVPGDDQMQRMGERRRILTWGWCRCKDKGGSCNSGNWFKRLVPTLRMGMLPWTLCVPFGGARRLRPQFGTQRVHNAFPRGAWERAARAGAVQQPGFRKKQDNPTTV